VAFDWQLTVDIPTEGHDVRLNCILTPTRWQAVGPHAVLK
jgi:5-formyltetrahydrofolate cyclo-ligase